MIRNTDKQITQSHRESCEVQNKGATALSPYSGSPCYLPVFLFSIRLDKVCATDVSISERVSLSVSSSAKSVAHTM